MKTKLTIERMPLRRCTLPESEWQVAVRECLPRGIAPGRPLRLAGHTLTLGDAKHVYRAERRKLLEITA